MKKEAEQKKSQAERVDRRAVSKFWGNWNVLLAQLNFFEF